jgi:hypothetical protein
MSGSPTSRFRMTFDLLEEHFGRHQGSRGYLKILELAAKESWVYQRYNT